MLFSLSSCIFLSSFLLPFLSVCHRFLSFLELDLCCPLSPLCLSLAVVLSYLLFPSFVFTSLLLFLLVFHKLFSQVASFLLLYSLYLYGTVFTRLQGLSSHRLLLSSLVSSEFVLLSYSSRVKAEGWLSCLSVCLFLSLTLPLSPLPFVVSGASPLAPPVNVKRQGLVKQDTEVRVWLLEVCLHWLLRVGAIN